MANDLAKQEAKQNFATIRDTIQLQRKSLMMALPKHMTADRMTRIALSACSRNSRLLECTPESVALSLIIASETGLEPNGREAHLVPYKNWKTHRYEAQFQPDYKGLVQLAYRSGQVRSFHAAAVHAKDEFDFAFGTNAFVKHKPSRDEDPGELVAAYAIAALTNGGEKFVVLTPSDVLKRRKSSQAYEYAVKNGKTDSPWHTHPEAMWAKSAAKELCKWIPASAELARAVELDNQHDAGESQTLDGAFVVQEELSDRDIDRALSGPPENKKVRAIPLKEPAKSESEPEVEQSPASLIDALRDALAGCDSEQAVMDVHDEFAVGPDLPEGWGATLADECGKRTKELSKPKGKGQRNLIDQREEYR